MEMFLSLFMALVVKTNLTLSSPALIVAIMRS